MERLEALPKVQAGFERRLAEVWPEQWSAPTPCDEWTVRDLVNHVVVGARMYKAMLEGCSRETARIWRARGVRPHRVELFKVSTDPAFEAKLVDVVGLYLDPPQRAVVFCVDEKTQVQALDRTQPSLPMTPRRAKTMSTCAGAGRGTRWCATS